MFVMRDKSGEIRLVVRILLVISLFVAVAVILRFIPISIYTAILTNGGMAEEDALAHAKTIIFEHPIWATIIGILNGLISLPLVWLFIKVIEKGQFALKSIGLDWRRNSLLVMMIGVVLALSLYIADKLIGQALGSSLPSMNVILAGLSLPILIQKFVLYTAMGFGEEVVFRGYLQTRLVERYGAPWGILIASIAFTIVHLGFMSLSPVTIFSGVMLWAMIGALYHWTKSLYLVGMFHGVANTLLNTLNIEGTEFSGLIVHTLSLLMVVVFAIRRYRKSI